jgi:hypothetical protein
MPSVVGSSQRISSFVPGPATQGNLIRIRLLSGYDLKQQVKSDGATWLDRRRVGRDRSPLGTGGFGVEVREALDGMDTTAPFRTAGAALRTFTLRSTLGTRCPYAHTHIFDNNLPGSIALRVAGRRDSSAVTQTR